MQCCFYLIVSVFCCLKFPPYIVDGSATDDKHQHSFFCGWKICIARFLLYAQLITLIQLLLKLREHFSSAVILGVDELDRWHTQVSDTMNQLRTELSNIDYDQEAEEQNFPC